MVYTLFAFVVMVLASYICYQSLKFLWLNDWFLGWIRGVFGLSLLAVAGVIGLIAYDVYSYKQILIDQPIATISFEQIEEQYFDAVVVDAKGKQMRFNMHGDQWQLDARIIKWKGYFSGFDIKPAYRLDRLSGRYYDITKETTAKRSTFSLISSPLQLDIWKLINSQPSWFSVIDANYGSANYFPMRNGAQYEISLTHNGLRSRPLNDIARNAVSEWK